ncbi:hypothetical protein BO82DRAFT_273812 [Aspergillus uvarum CBS 121591]|uniref:Sister chromatid cohesion protein Dcc1 n=1 Tax=Aspergillus uvarum CBS 121591 TaxID=1448315 RepID=A0A319CKA5_9EURO|nr:hypothetical protein BO82DRAFT_273812 [Aspergillus uvarum CBS 121591]PYH86016.1 hypothetical protein BO82DRAFT_273812 [Aspergillus uvarum CBS 121591]
MSTQSTPSILFTHTAPQQGFRLLELPPEVADLLTSDNPPTLYLKTPTSTTAQPTTSSSKPTDLREYVNLCTPTQTYRIRQVQSSNSLHILRPSGMGGRDTGEGNGDGDMDVDVDIDVGVNLAETVTTIAKCGSTLELHVPEGGFRAAEFLGGLVGRFAPVTSGAAATGSAREGEGDAGAAEEDKVMETVFADIPVSRAECERVWVEGCAFVWRGRAWVPTPEIKMEVWKRVVDGAVVQGIDLRTQFLVDDLWKSVVVEDEDEVEGQFPRALFEAVVRRVVEGEEGNLDREVCVRWVGETYLEAMAPMASAAVGRSDFLNAWKDRLPEAWREEVALAKLTVSWYLFCACKRRSPLTFDAVYQLPDPTTISFVTEFERQRSKKNLPTDASAATAAKKSRNWHELFKNQKRQKR